MSSDEEVLFEAPNSLGIQGGINPHYDLYFTTKRVAVINLGRAETLATAAGAAVAGAGVGSGIPFAADVAAGAAGAAMGKSIEATRRGGIAHLNLDEKIKTRKNSFSVGYDSIVSVKLIHLHYFLRGAPRAAVIDFGDSHRKITFGLWKQEYDSLAVTLPRIAPLVGKTSIQR